MAARQAGAFADLVHHYRLGAGLTQGELATRAGLSRRGVSDLERGLRTHPYPNTVKQLADALELAPHDRALFMRAAYGRSIDRAQVQSNESAERELAVEVVEEAGATAETPTIDVGSMRSRPMATGGFLGAVPPAPLVAREREMRSVLELVDVVLTGQGQLVLLAGEPGIGKTRLAQEVAVSVSDRGFVVAPGRCYEPEQTAPFYPFIEALETLVGSGPASVRREIDQHWPYLCRLLDEADVSRYRAGQNEQQRLFRELTGFIQALAETAPVAILLDDLHWADESSLGLLQYLARHTRADRVLLLGTYRDVEVSSQHSLVAALEDLQREDLVKQVEVYPLGGEGTIALMALTLAGDQVPEELVRLVHERTEGNPFFVQQVMRMLIERGNLSREDRGSWTWKPLDPIEVPETVRLVIGRRLSRLTDTTRDVLDEASVLGQSFVFGDLEAMSERTEPVLENAIDEAERAGLVRETGPGSYTFDHALTQQSLYGELPARRRRRLHLAAGEALERLPDKKRAARAPELAWHFIEGDDRVRALRWSLLAGDQASAIFAYAEAAARYWKALELAREVEDGAQEARALERLGRILHLEGRFNVALGIVEESAVKYRERGDRAGEIRSVAGIGRIHNDRGTANEGITRLQVILDEGTDGFPLQELCELDVVLAHLYYRSGRFEQSVEHAQEASDLARELGEHDLLLEAEARRGTALGVLQDDRGIEVLEAVVHRAEERENLYVLHMALTNSAAGFGPADRRRRVAYRQRALMVAERLGTPQTILAGTLPVADDLIEDGRLRDARVMLQNAADLAGRLVQSWWTPHVDLVLAQLSILQGDFDKARQLTAGAANALERGADDGQGVIRIVDNVTMLSTLEGHPEEAVERLGRFLADEQPNRLLRLEVRTQLAWSVLEAGGEDAVEQAAELLSDVREDDLLGRLCIPLGRLCIPRLEARRGRWNESRELLQRELAVSRQAGLALHEAMALDIYGEVLALQGDSDGARRKWEEALAILRRAEAHAWVWRIQCRLASVPS